MEKDLFDDLVQSLNEAKAISKGEMTPSRRFKVAAPDAKTVREKLGLHQEEFAALLRISVRTLQNWEQHRRNPTGAASALLTVVDRCPDIALKALKKSTIVRSLQSEKPYIPSFFHHRNNSHC